MTTGADAIVVGAGLVGAAIAYGLARDGLKPVMLDEGDVAYRASRGNFALVWTQSKGAGLPEYQRWSRLAADEWPAFVAELREATGIDCALRQNGGFHLCLSAAELEKRGRLVQRIRAENQDARYRCEMLTRDEMLQLLPLLGPDVAGGSYCPYDGHVNPLLTLRALHQGFIAKGGRYLPHSHVVSIDAAPNRFTVHTAAASVSAPKLVLAAGLGNRSLGTMVNLDVPVRPVRGQIIVTERVEPVLEFATSHLRQTAEGSLLIGESREDAGFDDTTDVVATHKIAARAIRAFPFIGRIRVVRAWAALRVMSPDSHPVYEQSVTLPGAFVCTCHSGVTLVPAHALHYAKFVESGQLPAKLASFSTQRFAAGNSH